MQKRRRKAYALALAAFTAVFPVHTGALAESGYDVIVQHYGSALAASGAFDPEDPSVVDPVEAYGDEAIPIVEFVPVSTKKSQEKEPDTDINRVTFYDWYGTEVSHVDVPTGDNVDAPEEFPSVDGYSFQYWFDEVGELAPYPFEEPVEESLNLIPHYEVLPPESSVRVMAEDQVSNLVLGILGEDATTAEVDLSGALLSELLPQGTSATVEIVDDETPLAVSRDALSERAGDTTSGLIDLMGSHMKMTAIVTVGEPTSDAVADTGDAVYPQAEETTEAPPIPPEPENIEPSGPPEPTATEPPIDYNGIQVSTLITQILSTGVINEPLTTAEKPESSDAPASPEDPQEDSADVIQDEAGTGDATNILKLPAATESPLSSDERIQALANSILDIPATEETTEEETEAETDAEEPEIETNMKALTPEAPRDPYVEVRYEYKGDLTVGSKVTLRAHVYNLPETQKLSFQWQNDATGLFKDVEGATGQSYIFIVDSNKARSWNWRVNVSLKD